MPRQYSLAYDFDRFIRMTHWPIQILIASYDTNRIECIRNKFYLLLLSIVTLWEIAYVSFQVLNKFKPSKSKSEHLVAYSEYSFTHKWTGMSSVIFQLSFFFLIQLKAFISHEEMANNFEQFKFWPMMIIYSSGASVFRRQSKNVFICDSVLPKMCGPLRGIRCAWNDACKCINYFG